jgi:hypothetical protein
MMEVEVRVLGCVLYLEAPNSPNLTSEVHVIRYLISLL